MTLDAALETAAQHASATRHVLRLRNLHTTARLGHQASERAEPQAVMLSVTVRFALAPAACRSDRLEDTVCGAELCAALSSVCKSGEFALVEHLAERLYAAVRRLVAPSARVRLELTKLAPPIAGLRGGMSFVIAG
jgi:7,8-dihydroneopterin aldolase/epimerase/oxygenase